MPSKFGPSLDLDPTQTLSAPIPPAQSIHSKFGPSVNLDELESHRIGEPREAPDEWGPSGPLTQWINSPGILPGLLKGTLMSGGILPSPLGMPQAPNVIPGLTAPIIAEGQTALPKIPWLGRLAIGKTLGPLGKMGLEVYENMRGANVPPQMVPEGFPDYLPPAGPTRPVPSYKPQIPTPTTGTTGYPGLELPEGPPVYGPSLMEAGPVTPFQPGKVSLRNLQKFTPKSESEQFGPPGKIILRKGPPAPPPEAGAQGRTFIQNEDGTITEVKPVKGKPVTPKPGPQETPQERARTSSALHATAHEMDLGPESGPNKSGHALIARLAREMGRPSSKAFTAAENETIDGLMQQLGRMPTRQEAEEAFQKLGGK